jgi:hypothetical protein
VRSGRSAGGRRRLTVGTTPTRARSGKRPGGLGQSKPMWPRASFKRELGRTEQSVGLGSVHNAFPFI